MRKALHAARGWLSFTNNIMTTNNTVLLLVLLQSVRRHTRSNYYLINKLVLLLLRLRWLSELCFASHSTTRSLLNYYVNVHRMYGVNLLWLWVIVIERQIIMGKRFIKLEDVKFVTMFIGVLHKIVTVTVNDNLIIGWSWICYFIN